MKVEFGIKPDLFMVLATSPPTVSRFVFDSSHPVNMYPFSPLLLAKNSLFHLIMLVVGSYPSVADMSRYFPVILEIMAQCYIGSNVREVFGGKSGIDRSAPFR